jgi:tetratricopeptide (TPR) repeat protein
MEDIHDVQEEIARSIAGELRVRILPSERGQLATRPTDNVEAYEYFLRGRADYQAGLALVGPSPDEWRRRWLAAEENFQRATEIDPGYALAWAELGTQRARLYWWSYADHEESIDGARLAIDRAKALDPDLPQVLLAEASYLMWVESEFEQSLELATRAHQLIPGDPDAVVVIGGSLRRMGRFDEAILWFRELMERNPTDYLPPSTVWDTYAAMRRFDDAERTLDQWAAMSGDDRPGIRSLWTFGAGDTAEPRRFYDSLTASGFEVNNVRLLVLVREFDQALAVLDGGSPYYQWQHGPVPRAYFSSRVRALQGDQAGARLDAQEALAFYAEQEGEIMAGKLAEERAIAYAILGDRERAIAEARAAVEMQEADLWSGVNSRDTLMDVYIILGDADSAIEQLEFLLSTEYGGAITLAQVLVHPRFDPLRGHPRFERLIAEHTPPRDP